MQDIFCNRKVFPNQYGKISLHTSHTYRDCRHTARHLLHGFVNSDGTRGPHWTYEQTKEAAHKFGVNLEGKNFRCYDWFVVLNMVYSDYYHSGWGVETYIELAKDFLNDKDFTKPGKAKWYFQNKKDYLS